MLNTIKGLGNKQYASEGINRWGGKKKKKRPISIGQIYDNMSEGYANFLIH